MFNPYFIYIIYNKISLRVLKNKYIYNIKNRLIN